MARGSSRQGFMKTKEEQLKLFTILALLVVSFGLSYYFLFVLKTSSLYTHFFYIPIILACMWWRKRGIFVGLLLILWLVVSHLILMRPALWAEDLIRIAMFAVVAILTVALSEKWEKTAEELKRSEEKYKNLIVQSVDGIYIIQEGRFKFTNAQFQKVFDYTEQELLNKDVLELVTPEDVGAVAERVAAKERGEPAPEINEFRAKKKSGEIVYVEVKSVHINYKGRGAIQGTLRDITKRKMAQEEVKVLSDFNKKILDNVPISILVLDKKGSIIALNRYYEKLTGFSKYDRLGSNLLERRSIKKNKALLENYKKLLAQGKPFFQQAQPFFKRDDSSSNPIYLNISAVPLKNRSGRIEGAISIGQDITQLIMARDQLKNVNAELEEKVKERTKALKITNQELERAIDFKSRFIADTSHELRTPLTIIRGNLDLISKNNKDSSNSFSEELANISEEVERMSSAVADLMMLSKVDAGEIQLHRESFSLDKLIQKVGDRSKHLIKKGRVKIEVGKLESVNIVGDQERLEKLIVNLISNGIRYGKNRGGWVKVSLNKSDNTAQLAVEDNGIGIPEKDLPYIFDRFYRVDRSRSRKLGGTGLGLAICKWVAEAHGGRITAESTVGKGSKFFVDLPVAPLH